MSGISTRIQTADQGYIIEDRGLVFTQGLDKVAWMELGRRIVRRTESSLWALGDWLAYGGRQGEGGRWIGSSYATASAITGYSSSYLCSLHNVAKAYTAMERSIGLPWIMYRTCLKQPEDRRRNLLLLAKQKRWTSTELRDHIFKLDKEDAKQAAAAVKPERGTKQVITQVRSANGTKFTVHSDRHGNTYRPVHVKCPKCAHVFPVKPNRAPADR